MKIYIAGPMTGLPDYNFAAFNAMAFRLRTLGHVVVNPAECFEGRQDLPYKLYMRAAVTNLAACDAVAVLPGWQDSRGANFEIKVAEMCDIPVMSAPLLALHEEREAHRRHVVELADWPRANVNLALKIIAGALLVAALLLVANGCESTTPHSAEVKLRKIFGH